MVSDAPEEAWARARLGVGPKAGRRQIRRAFRQLSKLHHPDRGGSSEVFEEIRLAYDLLRDADQGVVWLTDEPDDPDSPWFAYDSPPPPPRTTFRQVFRDTLRDLD